MALTQEQMEKYGLSLSDAKSSDHDKGIVAYGDNFYEINDFERQQNEGKDTDQGATFDSDLYKDAQANGFSVKNFNTATDIEGALEALDGVEEETTAPAPEGPIEYSDELQSAMDRVNQWEKNRWEGTFSQAIYGNGEDQYRFDERPIFNRQPRNITEGRYDDGNRQQEQATQAFTQEFIDETRRDPDDLLRESNQL